MGASNNKEKSQVDASINHPKFMQAKILSEGDKRTLQTTTGVDQKSYNTWAKTLQSNKQMYTEFLMIPIKHQFATKGLCGTSGTLTLDFQNYPQILTDEIEHRKGKKSRFQETQLWLLLYSLVAAKRDFSLYSQKVGDIRPQNIFLSEENKIKVVNSLSWPQEDSNIQKAFNKERTYLAPQQLKALDVGEINQFDNQIEPELFSIGLTVLSAGILTDMSDLYNLDNMSFNYGLFAQRLNFWKHTPYSYILRGTILNLCQLQSNKRIKTVDFTNWIDKHNEPIKQLKNFSIPDAPPQLHNSVQEMTAQLGKGQPNITYQPQAPTIQSMPYAPIQKSDFRPQIRQDIAQTESIYAPVASNLYNQGMSPKNYQFNYQNEQTYKQQGGQTGQQQFGSKKQIPQLNSPKK